MTSPAKSLPTKIAEALDAAEDLMSVDELCRTAAGKVDDRIRNNVYLILHRMGEDGSIECRAKGYRKRPAKKVK